MGTTIKIDTFHGISPRTHPTQLADGMAVEAYNVRLKNGKLVPLREPGTVRDVNVRYENGLTNISEAKSIYCWKHTKSDGTTFIEFLAFPGVVWFAESNIADDEYERLFISGDTGVSYNDGSVTHDNAPVCYYYDKAQNSVTRKTICKRTLAKLKVTRSSNSAALDEDKIRYAYFFATWVDAYGYESGCSVPSEADNGNGYKDESLEYNDGDTISIAALDGTVSWWGDVSKIRIYKTVAGTTEESDQIEFVKEFGKAAVVGSSFTLKVADEDAGEVMPEFESPSGGLKSVMKVPGAFYCGFDSSFPKSVMFSDINYPTHWPVGYRYDVNDNIVALAVTSGMVCALTDGWPYVLTGTAPEGMSVTKLAGPASCLAPRGVCVYRNAVYFVSSQGLMTIYNDADDGTLCQNVTDKVFTKDQWLAFNPSSCVMGQFDGALFLFFTLSDGKTHKGLCIDLNESENAVTTHGETAKCVCTDNRDDKMYYVREAV